MLLDLHTTFAFSINTSKDGMSLCITLSVTITVSLTVTLSFTLTATDAMLSDAMRCFYRYPMLCDV